MRPLLLSTFDRDGGAARAAARLHLSLLTAGVESAMLVQGKSSQLPHVVGPRNFAEKVFSRIKPLLEKLPTRRYEMISKDFSAPWAPTFTPYRVREIAPDLVHLHWISYGFLGIRDLVKLRAPLVWTVHDMWAFTGGCHYPLGCERFTNDCGACPILGSTQERDLSRKIWEEKHNAWRQLEIDVIAPSRWMRDCALRSKLFHNRNIRLIPNAVDVEMFKPNERTPMRQLFNLPQAPKLVLFGAVDSANNPRKGPHLLRPALEYLRSPAAQPIELVVLGQDRPSADGPFPLPTHYMGSFSDELSLAALYGAVDVVVLPSIEDNLPNVALEALASGRPCVSFDIGGLPDLIAHRRSGYLAKAYDTEDLARGILFCLDERSAQSLAAHARDHVLTHFTPEIVARQHIALYEEVLTAGKARHSNELDLSRPPNDRFQKPRMPISHHHKSGVRVGNRYYTVSGLR
jgi:glycosyltransferase involved in cell wall biosynthesis